MNRACYVAAAAMLATQAGADVTCEVADLAALLPLTQTPRIAPGDYGDLVSALKTRVQKDANVFVVALAAQPGDETRDAPSAPGLCQ